MAMQIKLVVVSRVSKQASVNHRYDAIEAINSNKGIEDIPKG